MEVNQMRLKCKICSGSMLFAKYYDGWKVSGHEDFVDDINEFLDKHRHSASQCFELWYE